MYVARATGEPAQYPGATPYHQREMKSQLRLRRVEKQFVVVFQIIFVEPFPALAD
jgi:hypothetical protein